MAVPAAGTIRLYDGPNVVPKYRFETTWQTCSGLSIIPTCPQAYARTMYEAAIVPPASGATISVIIGKVIPTNPTARPVTIPAMNGSVAITTTAAMCIACSSPPISLPA